RGETLPFLADRRRLVGAMPSATKLGPWLADVESEMSVLAADLAASSARRSVLGETKGQADAERVKLLTKVGSRPPANALRLTRDPKTSFKPQSDAALQVLGAVRPELRDTLPVALSPYKGASPTP